MTVQFLSFFCFRGSSYVYSRSIYSTKNWWGVDRNFTPAYNYKFLFRIVGEAAKKKFATNNVNGIDKLRLERFVSEYAPVRNICVTYHTMPVLLNNGVIYCYYFIACGTPFPFRVRFRFLSFRFRSQIVRFSLRFLSFWIQICTFITLHPRISVDIHEKLGLEPYS